MNNEINSNQGLNSSPNLGEVSAGRRGKSEEIQKSFTKKFNNLQHLKDKRKSLRNNLTSAEAKLWNDLKGKKLEGRKFRRQHSVANYILDFYCPTEKLAIELDGQGHYEASQSEYDKQRDLFLNELKIKVIRFENKLVFESLDRVLEKIKMEFKK